MSTTPNIKAVWKEYRNELVMNCVVMEKQVPTAVPIDESGEDTLLFIFDNAIKDLILKDKIPWDPNPGPLGVARRFLLSTAAAVGRYAARHVGTNGAIDKKQMEDAYDALVRDWEKVCPLPIASTRTSCPIPPAVQGSRMLPYTQAVHAGAKGRKP